ncbi:Diacylglycerol O-acyltransferase 2A [Paramyrothecium foliicola]|nr:Diacylglycerol O-acyltransferase 2A [Paramyrothecium foliicola]
MSSDAMGAAGQQANTNGIANEKVTTISQPGENQAAVNGTHSGTVENQLNGHYEPDAVVRSSAMTSSSDLTDSSHTLTNGEPNSYAAAVAVGGENHSRKRMNRPYPPLGTAATPDHEKEAWKAGGIRFAPMSVPLVRRMQTGAVLFHCMSIVVFVSCFWFVCANPLSWPILVPYLIHLSTSTAATNGNLAYRSEYLRSLPLWKLFAGYFPAKLHKTYDLPPNRKYIFGYHPHGIISHGAWCAFATNALGFAEKFPGITNSLLTLDSNFRLPFYRDWILAMGLRSVSKESITNTLTKGGPDNDGQGRAVTIVIGGARESLEAQPGTLRLILQGRKGFIKMALRTGADLVPVIAFGENDIYDQLSPKTHPIVNKIQIFILKVFKFTVPALHGRGVLNYDVGLMPYRRPINIVMGRPIEVGPRNGSQPSQADIDDLHEQYVQEVEKLYEAYKDKFASNRVEDMRIISEPSAPLEVFGTMRRSSARKKQPVNYNEDAERDVKLPEPKTEPKSTPTKAKQTNSNIEPAINKGKRKAEVEADPDNKGEAASEAVSAAGAPKKRKKKEKAEDAMPLAERTAVSSLKKAMYIGAHVSAAGGVQNAVANAIQIGANSFALFLKSQRKWDNPPMTPEAKQGFISQCSHHSYDAAEHALPHGSYLVNLAQADEAKAQQAYNSFVEDLGRCEQLGIKLYNFHPGNTNGEARPAAIARIAAQLNKSHAATKTVVTVLENMAGGGNVIGSTWEDLRDIIALVEDKSRVGVCIDTCHAFAAGYDLRSPDAFKETMGSFNDIVGNKYLKAFHYAFRGMPMVLETPIDKKGPDSKAVEDKQVWADEIKLLESLIGMDTDGDDFARLDRELQVKGADERQRIQAQVDKKGGKAAKKEGKVTKLTDMVAKMEKAVKKTPKKKGKNKGSDSDEE